MKKQKKTKLKLKKSILRRFKVTGGGKVMHLRSFRGHLKVHKTKAQRKNKQKELTGPNLKKIKHMLGM